MRITHLPTGLVVEIQDEKSQHKNKAKAMSVLRSRLLDLEIQKQRAADSAARRSMVGSGDRSDKVRTYNFPQDRVTDHRIGKTVHNLPGVMAGDLDDLIDALIMADQADRLSGERRDTMTQLDAAPIRFLPARAAPDRARRPTWARSRSSSTATGSC